MQKIAIVGVGGMGTVHFNNYAQINEAEVKAVVGPSEDDRQKAANWGVKIYPTVEELLVAEEVDIVDICTPTFLHVEHALKALNAGKNIIIEKPVALHEEDAERIFALASEMDAQVFVGQVLHFTREVEILKEAVRSEKYGKVLDAYFTRLTAAPNWVQGGWMFDKEKSGLLPFDLHIHDLDLIISLFGRPESYSFNAAGRKESEFKEHYRFNYNFGDLNVGAEAAWFNANYPFTACWRVYFEQGLLVKEEGLTFYPPEGDPVEFDIESEPKIETGINLPPTAMFYHELSHFIDCAEKGVTTDRMTKKELITTVEILEEIAGLQ
ncbi:Gfo/Idh/MocA family protein [Halanaerobium sp. ST460_2HS_T2]|jgi:predicted dehydrogenase|uniref:Gfo/Idh/MocA family protein n=1 Tax=Halanaerobium sp. ST460_2HS_T2 TaxID=2183914 RepID=UPI000DF392F4|nr:Gfo/Idh/MocA family oxidoreductase [Halanaerobium sp. ST460_2HS_T2]RCW49966.1 putative dehydrogenase [Halanaerobium sp. ST460_2HS_T2]